MQCLPGLLHFCACLGCKLLAAVGAVFTVGREQLHEPVNLLFTCGADPIVPPATPTVFVDTAIYTTSNLGQP